MVLLIVGLTAVTYVATTLVTALRVLPGARGPADRAARALGITTAILTAGLALVGLRVGPSGSSGEFVPALALAVTASAALGSSAACALLASARGLTALGAGRRRRLEALAKGERSRARRLEAQRRHRLAGGDLVEEIADADAPLEPLTPALAGLRAAPHAHAA